MPRSRPDISPDEARARFLALPRRDRTVAHLHRTLQAEGVSVSRASLQIWSRRDKWRSTRRRALRSPDIHLDYLLRYLAMGEARSLARLAGELTAGGRKISQNALIKLSTEQHWGDRARAFDEDRAARLTEALSEEVHDMDLRQVQLGKRLQGVALDSVDAVQQDMTPGDTARWARVGVNIERLAGGRATSRPEATYNAIVGPILSLFQQVVVVAVPEGQRDDVMREFADGVNQIRDGVALAALPEGGTGQ